MSTPLYGLILSGGKSTRMGNDKGLLDYHGLPQRDYLYGMAAEVCDQVFFSIREEQQGEIDATDRYIVDRNEYRGPLNGILSAHKAHPDAAWVVLACDLPLLDVNALQTLVNERDSDKLATAYATRESKLPEPLVSIWEPKGLQQAMVYMEAAQSSCPRKFLINSDIKLIYPEKDEVLYNANSLAEYQFALAKVSK